MEAKEFETLAREMRKDLVRLAGRFSRASGLAEDSEDLVQEALAVLWELSESGYPIHNPKALAIKITKNICIGHYRKRKLRILPLADDLLEGGESADSRIESQDNERIRAFLYDRLSRTQQELLHLRNDEGLSLDEIASATGKSKGSIKTTISTARKQLTERLKKI